MIEIGRVYVGSGFESKIMLNPRYIKRIEPLPLEHRYAHIARSLIIVDDGGEDNSFIYSVDSYSVLKGKITKARNSQ